MINTDGSCCAAPSGSLKKSLLMRRGGAEDLVGMGSGGRCWNEELVWNE